MKTRLILVIAALGMVVAAGRGWASTWATAANTVAPTLNLSLNVQTAISLTLATGSDAGSCTINPGGGGDYSVSLGNVNGLGLGTPSCGTVATSASNATYASNYQVTPSYSGFSASTATIAVTAPTFTHSGTLTLEEGAAAGTMTAVPTSGTTHSIAASTSGAAIQRYLGVQVSNANGAGAFPGTAGASGSDSTLVTFTITVP